MKYMRFQEGGLDHILKRNEDSRSGHPFEVMSETICGIRAPKWFWSFFSAPNGPLKCEVCFATIQNKPVS